MANAMLISAAYGWFIGLLVMMIILAGLFIFIALITLKPYKVDDFGNNSELALRLLEEREAELTSRLLRDPQNAEAANLLRDTETARKLVKQLLDEENGYQASGGTLGVDTHLTEEEAMALDSDEQVSIEHTFDARPAAEGEEIEKSFTAKLMQAHDEIKVWYFELKNCILCYEKTKDIMRWNNEKFYIGRSNVATLTMRGKQLCLYLAVRAEDYSGRFPVKTSTSQMYNEVTPCLFRIKNEKSVKEAKELIALMMSDYGVMYNKTNHSIYALPYEDDDALVAKGLARQAQDKNIY